MFVKRRIRCFYMVIRFQLISIEECLYFVSKVLNLSFLSYCYESREQMYNLVPGTKSLYTNLEVPDERKLFRLYMEGTTLHSTDYTITNGWLRSFVINLGR